MASVLKIGGSLLSYPEDLRALCLRLGDLAGRFEILIVPGGGPFADAVRDAYSKLGLPEATSHRMAVLAMDQYGLLLQSLIGESARLVEDLRDAAGCFDERRAAVLQSSRLMEEDRSLPRSWGVTSDSIAAWVAGEIGADRLILVKSVDGLFDRGSDRLLERVPVDALDSGVVPGVVDTYLPTLLVSRRFHCFVVNGRHPDRVEVILRGELAVGTEIGLH